MAKLLIVRGIDVSVKSLNGDSALHLAAQAVNVELARILLENGLNIEDRNNNDETPLHCCAQHFNPESDHFRILEIC